MTPTVYVLKDIQQQLYAAGISPQVYHVEIYGTSLRVIIYELHVMTIDLAMLSILFLKRTDDYYSVVEQIATALHAWAQASKMGPHEVYRLLNASTEPRAINYPVSIPQL